MTAGTGISITNTSGAITIASSGTTGVPYTGANQAVNLGAYDLKVNGLTIGLGAGSMSNTVTGIASLSNNTTGNYNVAIGNNTLLNNTLGSNSTAVGYNSQSQNTYGTDNGSFGYNSLISNTTGSYNNAFGGRALNANTTGWFNTAIGRRSLYTNSTGNHNTAIGNYAGVAVGNLENATAIGDSAIVSNSNTIQLGNTLVTNVNTSGTLTAGTVTYPNTHAGTSGQVLTSLGSGTLSWTASAVAKPTSDQFTATAGQTSFTLTQTPITNTTVYPNIKPNVWMYINGTRTNNSAYSISGTTVTYTASANNSYTLVVGDRIQFDYAY